MAVINIIVKGKDAGATKVLGSVGKGVAALGVGAAALGGAAVAGVGALALGLGKLAIDAAPLEGIKGAFDGITESFEGGSAAMLAAMQQASDGMVPNIDLMKSFNEAAQLVSVDFAQKLPDAMGPLGKVAAATGQDMGFMIDSLVKGVGRMSPMILDNLGIQVNLAQATERAAEMFGLEADELSKAQLQAGLMDVAIEALNNNTAAMPAVAGTAAQQMAALQTQFANTKDEIGLALLPVAQQLMGWLGEFAQNMLPIVIDWVQNQLVPALMQFSGWMASTGIPLIKELAAWVGENLPPLIQKLKEFWVGTLLPALEQVWAFINDPLIPILSTIATWIGENLPPLIEALADYWLNTLKPALDEIWRFLSVDMLPIWEALGEMLEVTVGGAITALTGLWQNVLLPAITTVWEFIKDNLSPIIDDSAGKISAWKASMGGISGIINSIANKIKYWTNKIKELVASMPDWLIPGSPTPFELGLKGIAEQARQLRRMAPDLAVGLAGTTAGSGMPLNTITNQSTVQHHYNLTINSRAPVEPMVTTFEAMRAITR